MNLKNKIIAVVGLGYVGLPLAIEFGKKRRVIGFDTSEERISSLKEWNDSTLEVPSSDFQMAKFLTFTSDSSQLSNAEIFIVTVPTPVNDENKPDLTALVNACKTVGSVMRSGAVVIFESTVFPGATEEICVPILEEISNLKYVRSDNASWVQGFYCGYSPERINPGDKLHRLPSIVKIVSGSTPLITEEINVMYREIITAGTYVAKSIKVAEAAKAIENSQRDINIAFVNELSMIFERMNLDTFDVLEAASTKWNFLRFSPGLVGGHCIGVDPYYLTYKAEELGYKSQIILAGRGVNDNMASYVARKVINGMLSLGLNLQESKVGVLGMTFKEDCPDTRNSKVVDLIKELENSGIKVLVEDPWADDAQVFKQHGIRLTTLSGNEELDALVVAVGHSEFKIRSLDDLRGSCKNHPLVLFADLKSIFCRNKLANLGFSVFRL